MPVPQKELKRAIKIGIKTLIIQEIRLLRLERTFTPSLVIDEVSRSIQESKKEVVKLAKAIAQEERAAFLRKMIRQTVDEEIDRAVELRKIRCVRCLHGRFYDETGTAYANLPPQVTVETIGCDKLRPSLRKSCRRFVEMSTAPSLNQYLNEMALLYEFREVIHRIEEIWKDYLTK
jgi:hypothetical protein